MVTLKEIENILENPKLKILEKDREVIYSWWERNENLRGYITDFSYVPEKISEDEINYDGDYELYFHISIDNLSLSFFIDKGSDKFTVCCGFLGDPTNFRNYENACFDVPVR